MFNCVLSFQTGAFGTGTVEVFAGSHQFFSFDLGPAQRPVAIFGNLVATRWFIIAGRWAGVDRQELALGEAAQRQINMADHLASRPLVDHLGNTSQRAPIPE